MTIFKTFWQAISNVGIFPATETYLRRKIILTNQLAFTVSLAVVTAWITLTLGLNANSMFFGMLITAAIVYSSTILFNALRWYTFSRIWFNVTPLVILILGAGMISDGQVVSFKISMLSVVIVPLILFGIEERIKMLAGVALVVFAYLSMDFFAPIIPNLIVIDLGVIDSPISVGISGVLSIVLLVISFTYFQEIAHEAEQLLKYENHRMSVLNDMSQHMGLAPTEEEVLKITARYTAKIFRAVRAVRLGVDLLTESGDRVETFALAGDDGHIPLGSQWLTSETVVGRAINEQRLIVTDDARTSQFVDLQTISAMGFRSAMNTPLSTGGKTIGTLNIATKNVAAYTERDQKLVVQTASIVAANIQNRRFVSQLEQLLQQSEDLLLNILPVTIAKELKERGKVTPVYFENTTVLFTDFKGFTKIAEKLTPNQLVKELDTCFSHFDKIAERFNLEKLKTIGDSYMCAGGLPITNSTHAIDACLAALEIQAFMDDMNKIKKSLNTDFWELRLGIHSGPVMAGVIGEKKFAYDIWGDTVNTASRMESSGTVGRINISYSVYELVKDFFDCEYRGELEAKNKGKVKMYYVYHLKSEYLSDKLNRIPNERFKSMYAELQKQQDGKNNFSDDL